MSHYCSVCGRELTKTAGPIGPKCLQKMKPRNIRVKRVSKAQYSKISASYDMYGGNQSEQREDDASSESSEGQETGKNGENR